MGELIAIATHIIYAYTTATYRQFRNWYKVGQTEQESAEVRVSQQDGTSNPEPLEIDRSWTIPAHISDSSIHAELRKMGCAEVRLDKKREWYECTLEQIDIAINNLIYGISRPLSYGMRLEQRECVQKAVSVLRDISDGVKKFLINAKMRYGKTFVTYQIMRALDLHRVLVLTYKPAVDANWREDLELHVDFADYTYHSAADWQPGQDPISLPTAGRHVLFASFQDINDLDKHKWSKITAQHFDMVVIDETHYGSNTERARDTLSRLRYDRELHVSGTPLKALARGDFEPHEIYTWSIVHEAKARKAEEDAGWVTEDYRPLPVLKMHLFDVVDDAKRAITAYDPDEGFTMTKMFSSDDGTHLRDVASVKLFVDQIFGIGVHKSKSPIRMVAADHMLMVMPPSVNSANAFARFLKNRKGVGDQYHIINVAGDNEDELDNVKQLIRHHPKTITVTCGRFTTGVTVPQWDMVMMLDDGRSAETYYQTIFRCQSPDKNRPEMKEECHVIDFNPQRCLQMAYDYCEIEAPTEVSTKSYLREFLDFVPILDHSGNSLRQVQVDEVLNVMSTVGGYEDRFGSVSMLRWDRLSSLTQLSNQLSAVSAELPSSVSDQVTDNDIEPGKNYKPQAGRKKNTKGPKDPQQELREKVMTVMRRIPTYLFVETGVECVQDIIRLDHDDLFEDATGISISVFKQMCDHGLIKVDRLDRCITSYNQLEKLP